ncbi:MAG TPA: SLATT domain-containing protein [Azospirillum sp.]|nr:SLATT domain-containing protein [Azospirillum sp.]
MDLEEKRTNLLREMKITKGARFNAAERLGRRDRRMITITAFASVYVILLTILPMFVPMEGLFVNISNFITIIFSLIILAASLLQYSNNDPVRAEQHHRCGLEINALRRALRAAEPITKEIIFEHGQKYDEILQKYGINHDPADLLKYKAEHPDEFPTEHVHVEQNERRDEARDNLLSRIIISMSAVVIGMGASVAVSLIAESNTVQRILSYIRGNF